MSGLLLLSDKIGFLFMSFSHMSAFEKKKNCRIYKFKSITFRRKNWLDAKYIFPFEKEEAN